MKRFIPRKRTAWVVGGSLLVILYQIFSLPDGAPMTVSMLGQLATPILAVWFAYLARKALLDYLDLEEIVTKAKESTVGAGLIFVGNCIVFYALLGLFGNQLRAEELPKNAYVYVPQVVAEQTIYWPEHPKVFCLQA